MRITPVVPPLPGEHLAATSPVMRPEAEGASWRQRLDFWTGRALTRDALDLEQLHRAARLTWRGRLATAGIVNGLEVALEAPARPATDPDPPVVLARADHFLHLLPGHGFLADGEDVIVPRPMRVPLGQIPLHYVRVFRKGQEGAPEAPLPDVTAGEQHDAGGFVFHIDTFTDDHNPWARPDEPWAAVLVLAPTQFRVFDRVDPTSPCELDPSQDAFADERWVDACVLRLCELPAGLLASSTLVPPSDPAWRNALAHAVFERETRLAARQHLQVIAREDGGWATVSRAVDVFPWEILGVPLALLSSEPLPGSTARRFFLDRGTVVRAGGQARPRTRPVVPIIEALTEAALDIPSPGAPSTWRARVDQFAEHIGAFNARSGADIAALASAFRFIPPSGLLPRSVLSILRTDEALSLPRDPDRPIDRAGTNHLFPPQYLVEVVPVAVEDMDAALAASAPLTSYDLGAPEADDVRLLVPVPQRLFDPRLLVVEEEDPVFAAAVARFVASRQDWRQRRDAVRAERDALRALISGPLPAVVESPLDPGQLEPEPVQPSVGLEEALVSPLIPPGPWEMIVDFRDPPEVTPATVLFLKLRIDEGTPPSRIEVRWRTRSAEFPYTWTERPSAPPERFDDDGQPRAVDLFELYTVPASLIGLAGGPLTGMTVHLDAGRIALAWAGAVGPEVEGKQALDIWWRSEDLQSPPRFVGAPWTRNNDFLRLLAPFEDRYFDPLSAFATSIDGPLRELNAALNPLSAVPRVEPLFVAGVGLERMLAELDAEESEADDFVDSHFTRTQTNLYRIRKLILGETAAQQLLINPAIAEIAEQETAVASAEQLGSFIRGAKTRTMAADAVNKALRGDEGPAAATFGTRATVTAERLDLLDLKGRVIRDEAVADISTLRLTPVSKVKRELPETGPILPPRGLSIGRRFAEPPATKNLSYARAGLIELLDRLPEVRMPLVGETVRSLGGQQVSLLALQGRARPPLALDVSAAPSATGGTLPAGAYAYRITAVDALGDETPPTPATAVTVVGNNVGSVRLNWSTADGATAYHVYRSGGASGEVFFSTASGPFVDTNTGATAGAPPPSPSATPAATRAAAMAQLLSVPELEGQIDEAEITLAALDMTEIKSAILRTIERVIEQRRPVIERGIEALDLIRTQHGSAAGRVLVIEGELSEARHDVSVARALRQEEQQRVAAVNERRDTLIRNEVTFLAYVRPRKLDLIRRSAPYWKLDLVGVPAPLPACLQRHDEPPAALNAYLQLFQHAPARWFTALAPLLTKLDTPDKVVALLDAARLSAASFLTVDARADVRAASQAVQVTVLGAQTLVNTLRQRSSGLQIADVRGQRWQDLQRDALEHAAVGDLIAGRHGSSPISAAASAELDQIGRVATCLHAEFAGVPPAVRLSWIERFSQFDRPAHLRDLTVLPQYARLDRATRRRLQEFADWLFGRVGPSGDAQALIDDLVRLCLLLASHAPVNRIIAGHVPRPTPVRPGIRVPIRPLNPELVRVGMEVHVWRDSRVVARGLVDDLQQGEVSARMDVVDVSTTTLDATMRVQFVPAALSFFK